MEKIRIYIEADSDKHKDVLLKEDLEHFQIVDAIDKIMGGNDKWDRYSTMGYSHDNDND